MLNSVSRSLSDVGRTPSQVGAFSRRPFNVPAITRNQLPNDQITQLPDLHEPESLFPSGDQAFDAGGVGKRRAEPPRRFLLRGIEHLAIADQINHAKGRQARLACAEEIPRPAQLQITFGDLEAV